LSPVLASALSRGDYRNLILANSSNKGMFQDLKTKS
jgi:hypothetical protein